MSNPYVEPTAKARPNLYVDSLARTLGGFIDELIFTPAETCRKTPAVANRKRVKKLEPTAPCVFRPSGQRVGSTSALHREARHAHVYGSSLEEERNDEECFRSEGYREVEFGRHTSALLDESSPPSVISGIMILSPDVTKNTCYYD